MTQKGRCLGNNVFLRPVEIQDWSNCLACLLRIFVFSEADKLISVNVRPIDRETCESAHFGEDLILDEALPIDTRNQTNDLRRQLYLAKIAAHTQHIQQRSSCVDSV